MDNSSSLVSGRNPTGGPIISPLDGGFVPGAGSSSGANPMLPAPNLPANAPLANPYDTSVVPGLTFGANGGGYSTGSLFTTPSTTTPQTNVSAAQSSPIGGLSMLDSKDIGRLFSSLKKTYGDGTAHLLLNFLTSGAGFNQQAINNMLAALQPGIERGTENLMEQFSTSGNRFSSGAQIGLADYLSQVQLNEGQIESQMYEQATQNFLNVLMGTSAQNAQTKANSPSIWDTLGGVLNLGGGVASALSQAGVGGTAGSILDVIGSLGGLI